MRQNEEIKIKRRKIAIALMEYVVVLGCLITLFVMITPKESIKQANSYAKPEEVTKYILSDGYISRIRPLTEYTTFKEIAENTLNENYEDKYTVKVYSDAEKTTEITQGYITTGMIVEYTLEEQEIEEENLDNEENVVNEIQVEQQVENKETIEFITNVIGDMTKDGDCNISELTQIIRNIIGLEILEDKEKELSADFNGDGQINVTDVSMCINYIVYGTMEADKLVPNTPTIEMQGQGNINGHWYNSDVNITITENEKEEGEISKTQTIIEAKLSETDKTKIQTTTEKEFKLSKEGNYKISSQNYGNNGTRSGIVTQEINIDKTMPEIINLDEENIDTTTSNIFIKANDNAGIVKYKLIKDEEEKIVREIQINKNFEERIEIKENGLYKIIVEDIAGNIREQEIEISGLKNTFTIKFVDEDGTQLSMQSYRKGEEIEVIKNPIKRGNETYTYEFAGWQPEISRIAVKDEVYTATYQEIYREYSVKFVDDIGNILSEKTDYHYGDAVQIPEGDFSKENDTYIYEFVGWNVEVAREVTKNATYRAAYNKIPKEYTIRFLNEDGTEIIEERTFKSTDRVIEDEPIPPHNDGYVGKWEEYTLRPENIEVRVYYEEAAGEGETLYFTDTNGITWRFTNENGYAVDIYQDSGEIGETLNIPYSLDGYIAKSLANSFADNITNHQKNNIKNINLPKTLETIGVCAFSDCNNLEQINIPNSVKNIEEMAFRDCYNLKNINGLKGVEKIGSHAFYQCQALSNIELPDSVIEIGDHAFWRCYNLKNVKMPNRLDSIKDSTFEECENLSEIELPNTITEIGARAFMYCSKLNKIEIPDNVNIIKENTFFDCYNLREIKLGNSLESIENDAFYDCQSLIKIEIPSSVTNIGEAIFSNCNKLEDIIINNYEGNITFAANWCYNCRAYVHFIDCKHTIINNIDSEEMTIEFIDEDIWQDGQINCDGTLRFKILNNEGNTILNKKLIIDSEGKLKYSNRTTEIIEPNNDGIYTIKNIKRNIEINKFENIYNGDRIIAEDENGIKWKYYYLNGQATQICYDSGEIGECLTIPSQLSGYPVKNINIDESNDNIFGEYSNSVSAYNISRINIPEGIEGIECAAFAGLNKIKKIAIPSSVTYIEDYAFYNCENLTDIYIDNEKADMYLGNEWNPYAYVHYKECEHSIEVKKYTNAYSIVENVSDNVEDGKIKCHDTYKFRILNDNREIITSQKVLVEFEGLDIEYKDYERVRRALENANNAFENAEEGLIEIQPDEEGCYEIADIHRNLKIMIGSFQAKDSKGITWNYSLKDGNATNVYYEKGNLSWVVQIPDTLDGHPVVSIENKEGPSNIFKKADNRSIIEKVIIPEGVTKIGRYAFYGMSNLSNINLPSTLQEIGYASLYGCENIQTIDLPDTVTNIGDYAFALCRGIHSIEIPQSITRIGKGTFGDCSNLENIEINGNIDEIDDNAFKDCYKLKFINIPNGIKRIGMDAFGSCSELKELNIPGSIEEIDDFAFNNVRNIENIYINGLRENIQLGSYVFDWVNKERIHFSDCMHTIKAKVYTEGIKFEDVTDNIQDGKINCQETYKFKLIDENTGEIVLNQNVKLISKEDYNAYSENEIESDEQGIYTIDNICRDIIIKVSEDYERSTTVDDVNWNYIYENGKAVNVYCVTAGLSGVVTVPDNLDGYPVVEVGNSNENYNMFNQDIWSSPNQQITQIILPESLERIGSRAFGRCSHLDTINIPNNITTIEDYAFYKCGSLSNIDLSNLISIGNRAFSSCSSLTNLNIPNATHIGDYAFYGCNHLTEIDMPNATHIGDYTFYNVNWDNSRLTSVNMPNATSIGQSAFSNCSSLVSIEMPNVISIGDYAFSGCNSLESIDIPNVTSIGNYALSGCSSLESIDMPNVISIGDYAFVDCNSLNSIIIWKNVEELGKRTFDNWNTDQAIYVEAEKQPQGWSKKWNYGCSAQIVYAYTGD